MISTEFGPGDRITMTADVAAPAEAVMAALVDLPKRIAKDGSSAASVEVLGKNFYRITAEAYGQSRTVDVTMQRKPDGSLSADATGRQFDATFHAESVPVSDMASRLTLTLTPAAKSFSARILLGTLRLTRSSLASAAEMRLTRFLTRVEQDYHKAHRKGADQSAPNRRKRSAG